MTNIAPILQRCPVCGSDAAYHREHEYKYGDENVTEWVECSDFSLQSCGIKLDGYDCVTRWNHLPRPGSRRLVAMNGN